jgi:muramoyltetrapeptide carboxypeptidase
MAAGEKKLSRFGFGLVYTKQIFAEHRFFAGTDETRLANLMGELEREDTHAIWCARGGYGALRLLADLDQAETRERLRANPKLLIGYSDITALHSYFWTKASIPALHAPLMATPSWLKMKRPAAESMFEWLAGNAPLGKKSHSASWPTRHLAASAEAEGIILGGNLSVLTSLLGTPWQPNFEGALLFLEDCNEAPYRIDRMLAQLNAAGALSGLSGVLLGDLTHDVPKEMQKKVSWKQVVLDRFEPMEIPVLSGLPIGHGAKNEALPLGVRGRITRTGRLEILEQLVEV